MPGLRHTDIMQPFLSLVIYDLKGRFKSLFGFGVGGFFSKLLLKSSLGFEVHCLIFKALETESPDIRH